MSAEIRTDRSDLSGPGISRRLTDLIGLARATAAEPLPGDDIYEWAERCGKLRHLLEVLCIELENAL